MSRSGKAGVLAIAQGSSTLIGIAIFAALARIFDKADYGTYRQTLLFYQAVGPLLLLGLPQAVLYFASQVGEEKRGLVLENLLTLTATGALIALFLLCGGNRFVAEQFGNPALEESLRLFAPYVLAMPAMSALPACLLAFGKVRMLTVYTVLVRGATFALVVGVALWTGDVVLTVGALVGVTVVAFFPALALMLRAPGSGRWKVSLRGVRALLHYSIPLGLSTILAGLTLSLDKVIVSLFYPAEMFAVYANGAMEIPFISVVTGSIGAVLITEMTPLLRGGRPGEALALWRRSATKTAGILYPAFVGLMLFAPEVMTLLFSAAYTESAAPFRVYLLLLPFRVIYFGTVFQSLGQNRTILLYSALTLFFNVLLSIVFVRAFGPIGAAVATVVVLLVFTVPFCILALRRRVGAAHTGWVLPWAGLGRVMAAALACGALGLVVKVWLAGVIGPLPGAAVAAVVFGAAVLFLFERLGFISVRDLVNKVWLAHR